MATRAEYVVTERMEPRLVELADIARAMRARIRAALREAWTSPEAEKFREALAAASYEYGEELREIARSLGIPEAYRRAAEKHGIRRKYKMLWGKA